MSRDSTVIPFRQPEAIDDPQSEIAREGAPRMLAQVLIAEVDAFVAQWKDLKLPDGRDRVVRHGHGPQRAIQTGVGPVEVRRAKVHDRADVAAEEKIRFTSSILPKWARRSEFDPGRVKSVPASRMVKPRACAVLRLITSSNLVSCCARRSAGFRPRNEFSVNQKGASPATVVLCIKRRSGSL